MFDEETIAYFRSRVAKLYEEHFKLRFYSFEEVYQIAWVFALKYKNIAVEEVLLKHFSYYREEFFVKFARSFSDYQLEDEDGHKFQKFILSSIDDDFDKNDGEDDKLMLKIAEKLFPFSEERRRFFIDYMHGAVGIKLVSAFRDSAFRHRFEVLEILKENGALSDEEYQYYFDLAKEMKSKGKLKKRPLKENYAATRQREFWQANREECNAKQREYQKKRYAEQKAKKQAEVNGTL